MPEKISILKESGETLVSNIVSVFTIPETEKRYIITTENAVDPHGLTVLHVSEIVDGSMQKIATDDEWSSIKTIMRAIISGNVGSYKYLPAIANLNAVGQYSRDISVSASASKQMIDNYNAADKSAVPIDANMGATGVLQQPVAGAPGQAQMPVTPSTIFPTDGTTVSNDDELVPGIAELPAAPVNAAMPGSPVTPAAPVGGVNTVPVQAPSPVLNQGLATEPMVAPGLPEAQVAPAPASVPVASATPVGAPEPAVDAISVPVLGVGSNIPAAPVVMPATPTAPGVDPAAVNVAVTPVIDAQVNPAMGTVPTLVANETPVVNNNLNLTNEVQVATPTTVIPDAQIVQNAQNTSLTNDEQINFNATPSFDPNATLDEVVVAAQEMFMEGVKNLVVTIQEKVYRDLYIKEEEIKKREAAVAQKEQELGIAQPLASNAAVVPGLNATPATPLTEAPPVVQPTLVQASNDVI